MVPYKKFVNSIARTTVLIFSWTGYGLLQPTSRCTYKDYSVQRNINCDTNDAIIYFKFTNFCVSTSVSIELQKRLSLRLWPIV